MDQELEEFQDEVGPPGTEQDPAIPPDDNDEYHTPPPQEGDEGKVKNEKFKPFSRSNHRWAATMPVVGKVISMLTVRRG